MGAIASQITSLTIVYSTFYSGADQSKHQSSASLAFVWGIRRGPVNSPHKWPVTQEKVSIWWRRHVAISCKSFYYRCPIPVNPSFVLHATFRNGSPFCWPSNKLEHYWRKDDKGANQSQHPKETNAFYTIHICFCEVRRASHCHSPQATYSSKSTCCMLSAQKPAMHVVVYADRLTTQHSIVDVIDWSWSYWQIIWYPRWHVECFWPALSLHTDFHLLHIPLFCHNIHEGK